MDLLSMPFRLGPTGRPVTVEAGSDDAHAEGIATLALTRRGERPLVPNFGTTSPIFDELDVAELNAGLNTFGPPVAIVELEVDVISDTATRAVLTFD